MVVQAGPEAQIAPPGQPGQPGLPTKQVAAGEGEARPNPVRQEVVVLLGRPSQEGQEVVEPLTAGVAWKVQRMAALAAMVVIAL